MLQDALLSASMELHEFNRKRDDATPFRLMDILNVIVWPTLMFMWTCSLSCGLFGLRFYDPAQAFCLVSIMWLFCISNTVVAWGKVRGAQPARGLVAMTVCCWVAVFWGTSSGCRGYWWYMTSYYTYLDLAAYINIDTNTDMGQSYMDAGQIYFKEGTEIASNELVAFKSEHVYCAAPIYSRPLRNQAEHAKIEATGPYNLPLSGTVDFWAVGTDCCNETTKTFNCGEVHDLRSRSGLRMLNDDARPYYLMAVQEWVARLCPPDENTAEGRTRAAPLVCIQAKHPLFFHWSLDPLREVDNYKKKAERHFTVQLLTFFFTNLWFSLLVLIFLFNILGVR